MLLGISAGVLAILLAAFPGISIEGARAALSLCANVLIPSLFPFFVCANLLLETGVGAAAGQYFKKILHPIFGVSATGSAAIILGLISGYPTGAAVTASLYGAGSISKTEAQRLLAFTNNAGPLFVIGTVGVGMYKRSSVGYILLASTMLASFLTGILFYIFSAKDKEEKGVLLPQKKENAMEKAVKTMLSLCGYVVFFSVLTAFAKRAGIISFLSGFIEKFGITASTARLIIMGFLELSTAVSASAGADISAVAFIISWGGCSVLLQTAGIVRGAGLSMKSYIGGKIISSILAAGICRILLHLFPKSQSVYKTMQILPIETAVYIGYATAALCIASGIWLLFCCVSARKGRK